jgi:MFS family permease
MTARSDPTREQPPARAPDTRYGPQLDAVNFALADVKGAFGPYLGIFLLTHQNWNQASIGLVMTITGLVALACNAPIGAFIDATHRKRAAIVAAVAVLAIGSITVALVPSFQVVLIAGMAMAVAGDVFAPAVGAITLGLVSHAAFAHRNGRNAAFDHAGNVSIALLAGAVGYTLGQRAVFFLVPVFGVIVTLAVLSIPANAIDHEEARGGIRQTPANAESGRPSSLRVLLECRPLLILAACVTLFHFANAPMLHLTGQKLALANPGKETALMSACVIAAQLVMLPMALLAGARANSWGRKPLFLLACSVLPMRGVLYTLSDNAAWLVGVQLLDGVGNGLFGALVPLVIADLMRGTGHFNLARGAIATMQGIGASLSSAAAGLIVVWGGYSAAYLALAAVASCALLALWLAMPETRDEHPAVNTGRVAVAAVA